MDFIVIKAENLSVGYKNFSVNDITVSMQSGDIFGLVGRSGSGKSTFINTLVGLAKPLHGTLVFEKNGVVMHPTQVIGYSPQRNSLFNFLTIEENLWTFASMNGVSRKVYEERVEKILGRLDLLKHQYKRITELSGGMEKRVDLAVTLIHDPAIIILDEPFNGLDISLQRFIWRLLQELANEGRIVIITSHLLDDVQRYCTKLGLIENKQFYDDEKIRTVLGKNQTLQEFLEELFTKDLLAEERP